MGGVRDARLGWSRRRLAVLLALAAATVGSVGILGVRVLVADNWNGHNLVWNLVLAWVPLVVALLVYDGYRRGAPRGRLLAGGAVWLLFLPNAPYILTDYKLLSDWSGAPTWLDVIAVSGAAWTGLALGFVSLSLVHAIARRALGHARSWALVVAVLALSSFGVALGRFQRWNSWDVAVQPAGVLHDVAARLSDPLADGRMVAVTLFFTVFLTAAYAFADGLVRPRLGADAD